MRGVDGARWITHLYIKKRPVNPPQYVFTIIWLIDEFGGLTGYSLRSSCTLYGGTGKIMADKKVCQIITSSLYVCTYIRTCVYSVHIDCIHSCGVPDGPRWVGPTRYRSRWSTARTSSPRTRSGSRRTFSTISLPLRTGWTHYRYIHACVCLHCMYVHTHVHVSYVCPFHTVCAANTVTHSINYQERQSLKV